MYSAYKLNKQGDNIQPWRTPFPIWNQSIVACPVLTYFLTCIQILRRQIRWSGIPISWRTFHSLLWSTQSKNFSSVQFSHSVFATPWTAAHQASLSITNSPSLLKLMFIKSVMPPNHLILCYALLLLPSILTSIRFFSSESVLHIRIGASVSALVLPMNNQGWFTLMLTGLTCLLSKGFSRVFSNTTVQKHQFFSAQLFLWSNSHIHAWLLEKP